MSNFTTNDKLKKIVLNKVDKVASKVPGYKKVKKLPNKMKDAGFSVDVGKNKIGISYQKKF